MIIKPILSKKSVNALEKRNVYTFMVSPKANKFQIKKALEELFQVKVKKVRTTRKKPVLQSSRYLQKAPKKIYTKLEKKAFVELFPGQEIKDF